MYGGTTVTRIICIILMMVILLAGYSCERWKYQECKKVGVGHDTTYCVFQLLDSK